MDRENYVRCCECNEVHCFTELDDAPAWEYDNKKSDYLEKTMHDGQTFLMMHYGHEMEELRMSGESFVEGKSFSDPRRTVYHNMTNGTDHFVLKLSRDRVNSPVSFNLSPGHFRIFSEPPDCDYDTLDELIIHPKWGDPFLKNHREQFLQALKSTVSRADLSMFETTDFIFETPDRILYSMTEPLLNKLLDNFSKLIGQEIPDDVVAFIQELNIPGGMLNVVRATRIDILAGEQPSSLETSAETTG